MRPDGFNIFRQLTFVDISCFACFYEYNLKMLPVTHFRDPEVANVDPKNAYKELSGILKDLTVHIVYASSWLAGIFSASNEGQTLEQVNQCQR
jgi:hypothetical protein